MTEKKLLSANGSFAPKLKGKSSQHNSSILSNKQNNNLSPIYIPLLHISKSNLNVLCMGFL